jgi:ribosomal protein S18 acetylase RimI-like enzyme
MNVRRLTPNDREPLARMLAEIPAFRPDEVSCALELVDLALEKPQQSDYFFLVAEQDGQLAGYICYGPTPMTEGTWDLYWIASSEAARGKGAGSALVLEMEKELRGRGTRLVRIETSSLSEYGPARTFYARHAYHQTAVIEAFYRDGDDLVTLTKRLDRT